MAPYAVVIPVREQVVIDNTYYVFRITYCVLRITYFVLAFNNIASIMDLVQNLKNNISSGVYICQKLP